MSGQRCVVGADFDVGRRWKLVVSLQAALLVAVAGLGLAAGTAACARKRSIRFESGRPVCRRFEDVDVGLPQNTGTRCSSTSKGRLWAGTQDAPRTTTARAGTGRPARRRALEFRPGDRRGRATATCSRLGSQAAGFRAGDGDVWTIFEPGDSGLPDDRVNALLESERAGGGFDLWIGTHEAGSSVRYDGTNWTVYSTAAGLPLSQVWDLLLVGKGADHQLWIATGAGPATAPPFGRRDRDSRRGRRRVR